MTGALSRRLGHREDLLAGHVHAVHFERVLLETPLAVIEQRALPGRRGRLTFAYLVYERGRPVAPSELVDVLWQEQPTSCDAVIGAIVSKLRGVLAAPDSRATRF